MALVHSWSYNISSQCTQFLLEGVDRILEGRLLESDILYSKDDSLSLVKIMRFPVLSAKEVIFSQVFVC